MGKGKMTKVKLYNMDLKVQEWRDGEFKRGDSWRSNIVYRCEICHVETNLWIMGGWPGMGPRLLCPGSRYEEHDEIESSLQGIKSIEAKILKYKPVLESGEIESNRASSLAQYLLTEKEILEINIKDLRNLFSLYGLNNLECLDKVYKIEEYYPSSRYSEKEKLKK